MRTVGAGWGVLLLLLAVVSHADERGGTRNFAVSEQASLREHGIGLSNADLIRFLAEGVPLPEGRQMPAEPREKSELAVYAMAILAAERERAAVEILAEVAAYRPPPGVALLLDYDMSQTDPQSRREFRAKAIEILRYNALVGLGLIGDLRAAPVVRDAFAREQNRSARIQFALALGSLGDAAGIDYLAATIAEGERREAAASARAFYLLTGEDFGLTDHTSVRNRRRLAPEYRKWWAANRGAFQPDPERVHARRTARNTARPFEPRTTRDLIKVSTYYLDLENRMKSREARERLALAGRALNRDLTAMIEDPYEDLDIRQEAMNWFYEFNRSDARSTLRKLLKDENPEVRDKAAFLLEQAEEDAAMVRARSGR